MDVAALLGTVRTRWRTVLVTVLVALGAACAWVAIATPTYLASSQVYVSVRGDSDTAALVQGSTFAQQRVASYAAMVSTPAVLDPVIEELGLALTAEELGRAVVGRAVVDTSLIDISASSTDAATAARIADAAAASLAETVARFEPAADGGPSPVTVSATRAAAVPSTPDSPNVPLALGLGLVAGLACGVAGVALREALDTRVRTEAHVRDATHGMAVLAAVPAVKGVTSSRALLDRPRGPQAEAFRRLRSNLEFMRVPHPPRTLLVTSSVSGEGKTTTAVNLALALRAGGRTVLLVDADLRRSAVAAAMGLVDSVGLTTCLIGAARLEDVVQTWGEGDLDVLAAGPTPPNPGDLLGSSAMTDLLADLTSRYDVVVLDSAPLLPVADTTALAAEVDGVLLVAAAGRTSRAALTDAAAALSAVGARRLGIVLNRVRRTAADASPYDSPAEPRRRARPDDDASEDLAAGSGDTTFDELLRDHRVAEEAARLSPRR
ncbi:capsular exopolysaccharide family [Beutenbergia cavernae DSM 12333]|uniref:Capsular exopolysaccharide family n=1 Tax=Beutenbergia cavernae (strain ATCC BAA-8 / DSM 12333 / CCUG 43141 / JCM 11478 / NBRC 16432 / NCIMB 13614 / HKI 0122) TaxID=471853 RepID=C5C027_BEUC1|nr:polysaccharide biosynthesis tyrosine autokinase [Beutenbergia cavernae]ACQ79213.1 capsular exopolysaccharide family [Beutenbergia cavernae DSM 12333]